MALQIVICFCCVCVYHLCFFTISKCHFFCFLQILEIKKKNRKQTHVNCSLNTHQDFKLSDDQHFKIKKRTFQYSKRTKLKNTINHSTFQIYTCSNCQMFNVYCGVPSKCCFLLYHTNKF